MYMASRRSTRSDLLEVLENERLMLDADASNEREASSADPIEWLRQMARIRAFDSKLPDLYTRGLVRGSSHAAIGQEAAAVGAVAALGASVFITSTQCG